MKLNYLLLELLKFFKEPCKEHAIVRLHGRSGESLNDVVIIDDTTIQLIHNPDKANDKLTVYDVIHMLLSACGNNGVCSDARVYASFPDDKFMFVLSYVGDDDRIVIASESDCDLKSELNAWFNKFNSARNGIITEFCQELGNMGFTTDMVSKYCPDMLDIVKDSL